MKNQTVFPAVISGKNVLCGKCGRKIAQCRIKGVFGNHIWLLCKHKSVATNWDKCMTLNEVLL